MTYDDVMGYESSSRCPKCGSYNCADFDTPYWSKCLDCDFESMASEDHNKAIEYWVNGYADIEDKAKHVGIGCMDHEELLNLWWHENGFCACVDMGMSEEEIDDYWNSNPEALVEECGMMWAALGYHKEAEPRMVAYTSEELLNKFGTTNLDIINAGNEEYVTLMD